MGKKDKLLQISFLMEKLYTIDKELGGTAKNKQNAKETEGEFENIFKDCSDKITKVQELQKILDKRSDKTHRDQDVIVKEHGIRNELYYCQKLLEKMDKILNDQARNKKIQKTQIELRHKNYMELKNILYSMMKDSGINPPEEPFKSDKSKVGVPSLQQYTQNVLSTAGNISDRGDIRYQANDKEKQALQEINIRDEEQNKVLGNIYELVDMLDGKVKDMGVKQDHISVQIISTTKQVDKANQVLDTQNKRLKVLLTKYRAPSKFCLDITLLLFIIGLISSVYYMLK